MFDAIDGCQFFATIEPVSRTGERRTFGKRGIEDNSSNIFGMSSPAYTVIVIIERSDFITSPTFLVLVVVECQHGIIVA